METQMEETVQESHVLAAPERPGPNDTISNILLLGPTGVGKSTFINAICNYLAYHSLDEALDGGVQSVIYSTFISSFEDEDGEYVSAEVTVGQFNKSENSHDGKAGSSCTQSCKGYLFRYKEGLWIRLIDTPGIGDTRGIAADKANMTNIISFLTQYEMLHAICILLKPNEERLTGSLEYAIIKLLENLHKGASANIVFCFTNSRSSNFRPAGTLPLLTEMLRKKDGATDNIKLSIELKKKTMYCFDNESFRFLAMIEQGLVVSSQEREEYRRSWEMSHKEADRLITYITSLVPHRIKDTLSLTRVRSLSETIQEPLRDITASIQNNLQKTRDARDLLNKSDGAIRDYMEKLTIDQQFQEVTPLQYARTVCTEPSCKSICHMKCSSSETMFKKVGSVAVSIFKGIGNMVPDRGVSFLTQRAADFVGTPGDWVLCSKLNPLTEQCFVCNCPNDKHIRTHNEMRTVTRRVEDPEIRRVLDETATDAKKKQEIFDILISDEKTLQAESDTVLKTAVLIAAFLEQNSIVTYHSAIPHYYNEQITLMRAKGDANRESEFKGMLESYNQQVAEFKKCIYKSQDPDFDVRTMVSEENVEQSLQELYRLPINGPSLQKWVNGVESEFTLSSGRGEVVYNAAGARSGHAASASGGSHSTAGRIVRKAFRGGNHG